VPVTLTVAPPTTVTVNPTALTTGTQSGANPANQTIAITSTGASVAFTAAATTAAGGGWLSVTPASGSTPGNLTVSYNAANLAPGSYSGTVTITPTGLPSIQVPVTLTVNDLPRPNLTRIVNAASYVPDDIAPGQMILLGGTDIGPGTLTTLTVTGNAVDTRLAGTRVLFDGIPAPIIYARNDQTAVVVPYEVAGRFATNVQVELNGRLGNTILQRVRAASPGIFTQSAQGVGAGSILNQDFSLNTPQRGAARGEIISVYATGEGQTSPPGVTGSITTTPKIPLQLVTARIAGIPAPVTFYGSAPSLVSGVLQVNIRVPEGVPVGQQPIDIFVGGVKSQDGVTVSIR
jgi:uncharacterized protein (TIGR03437 family)